MHVKQNIKYSFLGQCILHLHSINDDHANKTIIIFRTIMLAVWNVEGPKNWILSNKNV